MSEVNSVVMIVPAAHLAAMNALAENMDYGANNFSNALSASGAEPATHYGTHLWEQLDGQFRQLRLAVQAGITPPGLEAFDAALKSLIIHAVENDTQSVKNWTDALAVAGLKEVVVK